MTLTICIKAKDGIILASDSRASSFLTSNDTVTKVFLLDDHTAVGIAGDGPLAIHLFDTISEDLNFRTGITKLAEQLRDLAKKRFEDWFSHQLPKERPSLQILLAGYNEDQPEIYTLDSTDNFVPRKSTTGFECIGIPVIANYLLNRLYEKDVIVEHALEMATFCIKETSSQDNKVGGPTQLATFSNVKSFALLSEKDIKSIEKKCEDLHVVHKAYFYPEDKSSGMEKPAEAKKTR